MPRQSAERFRLDGATFRRRFFLLILLTWLIPPVFGLLFILYLGILTPGQLLALLGHPLEPVFILGWLFFALWYFPRRIRPFVDYLDQPAPARIDAARHSLRRFAWRYWSLFLLYLLLAPGSVILGTWLSTGYLAPPIDWFRIHLVALIVSIIVGLPIFFLILDLFGRALDALPLQRPLVTIRTKVFLIGALVPLLIDTILVQYYWTRTGFFTLETFAVWLSLELLAVGGSLIFVRSFGQSLQPLQAVIAGGPDVPAPGARLRPRSTDELGVLTEGYRQLLEALRVRNAVLDVSNRLLRCAGRARALPALLETIVGLADEAIPGDMVFLILKDPQREELVGVIQSGAPYAPEGHFRLALDETSVAVSVYHDGQTLALDDVARDPRVSPRMREQFRVCSALATPLQVDEERLGVLMSICRERCHHYTAEEILLFENMAREAAIAIHTQRLEERRQAAQRALEDYRDRLEEQVAWRTAELTRANRELASFSYTVSHDLRSPLRAIDGFSHALLEEYGERLDATGREYLERVRHAAQRMGDLIDALLKLSKLSRSELHWQTVDLSALAGEIAAELGRRDPQRQVEWIIEPDLQAEADPGLLRAVLENLLGNAWKYTARTPNPRIRFAAEPCKDGPAWCVSDNGAGFDMAHAGKLFEPFQRLHTEAEFPGSGIGLATVQRIIQRHNGRIWAQSAPGEGARFCFTLGAPVQDADENGIKPYN